MSIGHIFVWVRICLIYKYEYVLYIYAKRTHKCMFTCVHIYYICTYVSSYIHVYMYVCQPHVYIYTYMDIGHIFACIRICILAIFAHILLRILICILNIWSIYICLCILEVWNTKWVWLCGETSTRIQTRINAILVSVFLNSSRICYRFVIDCFMDALYMDMYSHVHISIFFTVTGPLGAQGAPEAPRRDSKLTQGPRRATWVPRTPKGNQ